MDFYQRQQLGQQLRFVQHRDDRFTPDWASVSGDCRCRFVFDLSAESSLPRFNNLNNVQFLPDGSANPAFIRARLLARDRHRNPRIDFGLYVGRESSLRPQGMAGGRP